MPFYLTKKQKRRGKEGYNLREMRAQRDNMYKGGHHSEPQALTPHRGNSRYSSEGQKITQEEMAGRVGGEVLALGVSLPFHGHESFWPVDKLRGGGKGEHSGRSANPEREGAQNPLVDSAVHSGSCGAALESIQKTKRGTGPEPT